MGTDSPSPRQSAICRQELLDGPAPQGDNQAAFFGDGDEFAWRHHPAGGMAPAHQGFQTGDPSGRNFHLRLIEQRQLAVLERRMKLLADRHAFAHLDIQIGRMEVELVAAAFLGAVQSEIGLHQQIVR